MASITTVYEDDFVTDNGYSSLEDMPLKDEKKVTTPAGAFSCTFAGKRYLVIPPTDEGHDFLA